MRAYNFCAGPAALPEEVLKQAQAELLDYQQKGCSIMELSHRGSLFMAIAEQTVQDLRELLNIPANYKILFLQGGASLQFSMIPMNLLRSRDRADYINTGIWSKKAIDEAGRYCEVNVAASSEGLGFKAIPNQSSWTLDPHAAYVHYTPNETIGGLEFHWIPETGEVPLVADMSSTLLSRPLDVSHYGLIYAGAQKNIGPAGLTLVIVREDLVDLPLSQTPMLLRYKTYADNESMYNTPPTYSWYLAGLVFQWLKQLGGLNAMAQINQRKAHKLYAYLDSQDFYSNPIAPEARSWMNVPFRLADDQLDGRFLQETEQAGLLNLKGHRMVGGMRASIYNAVPEAAVDALINFMQDFVKRYG